MAKAGDEIVNPRTGQRMEFLKTGIETGGELLRIDSYNPPSPPLELEHVHPLQESGAEVIWGSLRFRVGGKEQSVKAGQSITIPANTPHHFWNDREEEVAHSVQCFRPALKIDRFFETYFALAQDGKLNEEGLPSFWQLAVMVPHFGDEIRMPAPPWQVHKSDLRHASTYREDARISAWIPLSARGTKAHVRGEEARPPATKQAIGGIVVAVLLATIAVLLKLLRRRHWDER